jgi:16S rRNA (cytidine1402-2'-O)-methyltransferase
MPGRLHVVSTPIGNLEDITLRALSTLKSVALIAAEDTRRTGTLLRHFGITTPTTSLHEHNERQKLPYLLRKLADGVDIALVSDAGTPLVSDPGHRLIAAALGSGVQVIPIPGASAVLSALVASGFPADAFVFAGFAPSRSKDRKGWFLALREERRTIVLFESPHRIEATLSDVAAIFGERPISVSRELTKLHEQTIHGRSNNLNTTAIPARGEFTVVLGPATDEVQPAHPHTDNDVATEFGQITDKVGVSKRRAIAETGRKFGLSTNEVYLILERLKASSAP